MTNLNNQNNLYRKELKRYRPGDVRRAEALFKLADSLDDRFLEKGEGVDLDEAIEFHRGALSSRPAGHPQRDTSLCSLALCLWAQMGRTAYNSCVKVLISTKRLLYIDRC